MAATIRGGKRASQLLQVGAQYRLLVAARVKSTITRLTTNVMEVLVDLEVPSRDRKRFSNALDALMTNKARSSEDEVTLARLCGDILSRTVAATSGLRVGRAVLPNSVLLPDRTHIVLPKALVGFRAEVERFLRKHPYDRNVFLMMPFRDATQPIRAAIRTTCARYKLHLIIADEIRIIETDLIANVLACLLSSKYGIAVFSKPEPSQFVNPNVAYELGLMHRDDKVCLVLKDAKLKHLPTDLIGRLYVEFKTSDKQTLTTAVETWIQERILT